MFFRLLFWGASIIIVIAVATPVSLAFFFPLSLIYQYMQKFYMTSSRELKRLDSISRSPIYNHFTETLGGAATIRAFQSEDRFTNENEQKLDTNQSANFVFTTASRWLAVRLEFMGTCGKNFLISKHI